MERSSDSRQSSTARRGHCLSAHGRWWLFALTLVLLAAFGLRLNQLDRQPLWWDEGISLFFAPLDLRTNAEQCVQTEDVNPPVYRLALGQWMRLFGSSIWAVRLFSATLGWLAVPLTWRLGRYFWGRAEAALATLLVALSPFQIYYSQEAKGYILVNLLALLSMTLWLRLLAHVPTAGRARPAPPPWLWLAHALVTAAMLGAHYYSAPLVLGQNLWLLGHLLPTAKPGSPARRESLHRLGCWIGSQALAAMALIAWLWLTVPGLLDGLRHTSTKEGVQALGFLAYLRQVFLEFSAGPDNPSTAATLTAATLTGLAGWAIWRARPSGRRNTSTTHRLVVGWLFLPLLITFPIQWRFPFWGVRFLLYASPAFYLLAASGLVQIARHHRRSGSILALGVLLIWTWRQLLPVAVQASPAEDFGPAARHLQALSQPGDALVYGYVWQVGYLHSYYPQNTLDFFRAYYTSQSAGLELQTILDSHPRLWLLGYRIAAKESHNLPGSWLEAQAYKVEGDWYGYHHLALYLAPDYHTAGVGPEKASATFDHRVKLYYPLVDAHLQPGDLLALPLHWQTLAPMREDYHIFVHLGTANTPPLAQNDGPPQNGLSPTSSWQIGQELLDRRTLHLPTDLPPGRYQLTLGLYRTSDGRRLPVDGQTTQEAILLGHIDISPRP
ncbi:MAG: glycosyltransferase family 39 protein [Chloroflexota bacterium]